MTSHSSGADTGIVMWAPGYLAMASESFTVEPTSLARLLLSSRT
jgi:hypothetical protein